MLKLYNSKKKKKLFFRFLFIYYICKEQGHKSLLALKEEAVFENVPLVLVKKKVLACKW